MYDYLYAGQAFEPRAESPRVEDPFSHPLRAVLRLTKVHQVHDFPSIVLAAACDSTMRVMFCFVFT
jgi:hypothetical protein